MTSVQNRTALYAIYVRQQSIRELLGLNPSPELVQYATKELEDLEDAYATIGLNPETGPSSSWWAFP